MHCATKEAAPAVESGAMGHGENHDSKKVKGNGSSQNRLNTYLPSPAGKSDAIKSVGGVEKGKRKDASKTQRDKEKSHKNKPLVSKGRKTQPGQARDEKFLVKNLANQISNYYCTDAYERGVNSGFKNSAALAKFNEWVVANKSSIDPRHMPVCAHCGNADLLLCDHFVTNNDNNKQLDDGVLIINAPRTTAFYYSFQLIDGIKKMLLWPTFDFAKQNNRMLGGFSNSDIEDENIIPELYNHIKVRMQTSYKVNGTEDRALKLAHCHRIALRWAEQKKLDLDGDTVMTNRLQFTIQRVCDNAENRVLYEHTDPTQNFLLARAEAFRVWLLFLTLYVIWGRVMAYAMPRLISLATQYVLPSVIRNWVSLFLVILQSMLDGSSLLCYEMIYNPFSGIGVLVICIAALSTFLLSIRRRR